MRKLLGSLGQLLLVAVLSVIFLIPAFMVHKSGCQLYIYVVENNIRNYPHLQNIDRSTYRYCKAVFD